MKFCGVMLVAALGGLFLMTRRFYAVLRENAHCELSDALFVTSSPASSDIALRKYLPTERIGCFASRPISALKHSL